MTHRISYLKFSSSMNVLGFYYLFLVGFFAVSHTTLKVEKIKIKTVNYYENKEKKSN